jgi:hypothetical protein
MAKARVFLAWSGSRSKAVATALRKWLPNVIQTIEPWMSENDIDKGARWLKEISGQLQNVKVGIICLTPENLHEPWINFEAGALSKLDDSIVCTYLHGLGTTDVSDPLAQFQGTKADKADTKKLVQTLNSRLGGEGLESTRLDEAFDKWWKDLEADLSSAKGSHAQEPPKRSSDDMLKEILTILRSHSNSYGNLEVTLANVQELVQKLPYPNYLAGATNVPTHIISSTTPYYTITAPPSLQMDTSFINQADLRRRRIIPEGIATSNEEGTGGSPGEE